MFNRESKIKNRIFAAVVLFQLVVGLVLPGILYPQGARAITGTGLEGMSGQMGSISEALNSQNSQSWYGKIWSGLTAGLFGKKEAAKKPAVKATPSTYTDLQERVPTSDTNMLEKLNSTEQTIMEGFEQESTRDTAQQTAEKTERNTWRQIGTITATAIKAGLRYFLNTLAYEYATFLASGDEGQQPMFYTEGWGVYLEGLADQSMGAFIESLGKGVGGVTGWQNFSLCEPPDGLKLAVTVSLAQQRRPAKPKCTLKQTMDNWQDSVSDTNWLDRFQANFDTGKNDITAALTLFEYADAKRAKEQKAAEETRKETGGWKGITDKISGWIKTPSTITTQMLGRTLVLGTEGQTNFTGDIVADAINTFVGTLAGKMFKKFVTEGLAKLRSTDETSEADKIFNNVQKNLLSDVDLLTGSASQSLFGGRQAAQDRFTTFFDADITSSGEYQILNKLAVCVNSSNPSSDECVIDHNFRLAIDQELTVKEAIEKGYLDGDAPFGFTSQGFEPPYNEGYPYRSLIILRTYRIIPVTWEIAAEVISRFGKKTYGLNDLIAAYDDETSPFYGLVDQNWVLKAPQAYCRAEGFGPSIISQQVINGLTIVDRDTYCADYQSCIQKDSGGNCVYGYCTEEERIWDLQGTECPDYYASCQAYVTRANNVISYLKNSLDYNGCSSDNVGCSWYCQSYNTVNGIWSCLNDGERVLKPCAQVGGCPLTAKCAMAENESFCTDTANKVDLVVSSACSRSSKWWNTELGKCSVEASCKIDMGGVLCNQGGCDNLTNFIPNSGFETQADQTVEIADNWSSANRDYFKLVNGAAEEVHGGKNSIRFYSPGGSLTGASSTASIITLEPGEYTLSAFVYNRLNSGEVKIKVGGSVEHVTSGQAGPVSKTSAAREQWEQISTDFKVVGNGQVEVGFVVSGSQVSGTVWFDDFKISAACIIDQVSLTLTGTIEEDQSKIHFDRDAEECSSDTDGCSQMIALGSDIGTNLVANSSFEEWSKTDVIPSGWVKGSSWQNDSFSLDGNALTGSKSFKLNNGTASGCRDFRTDTLPLEPGKTYVVSLYAKTDTASLDGSSFPSIWYNELQWQAPGSGTGDSEYQILHYSNAAKLGVTDKWQRFISDPITLNSLKSSSGLDQSGTLYGHNFVLSFNRCDTALANIYLDGVQVEEVFSSPQATEYKDYGSANLVNLRKPPAYLECKGYSSQRPSPYVFENVKEAACVGENLVWRSDSCQGEFCCHEIDPVECSNYAPYCQADEVGCQSYSPVKGGPTVPGVVAQDDYCPAECIGYSAFKQSPTYFESVEPLEFFIPDTAKKCSAASSGCDEFTNLDEVAKGGEGKGYYRYLRQCTKPADSDSACSNFYTWQGSNESGYQLRVYSLDANTNGSPRLAIEDDSRWLIEWGSRTDCDGPEDIAANPFCKELFAIDGKVYYEIMSNTISCSEDCHPFRKTRLGESDTEAETNCTSSNGTWQSGACIYDAVPSEALTCSAAAAGCREYRGNAGGNLFYAFRDSFEDGETTNWQSGEISSEALSVGGHSIMSAGPAPQRVETMRANLGKICGSDTVRECDSAKPADSGCYDPAEDVCIARHPVTGQTCQVAIGNQYCGVINDLLTPGTAYLLSFWAKAATSAVAVNVSLTDDQGTTYSPEIGTVLLNQDWNYYTFGPIVYDEIKSSARLSIVATNPNFRDFYVDNIEFRQIKGYSYVIKNSWQTPESCDINPFVNPAQAAPQFMLGCSQYQDSYQRIHNLKSFNHLCREEAVGCQAFIDTYNSASPFSQEFLASDPLGNVVVPADQLAYMVDQPGFRCSAEAKGCQRFGQPTVDQNNIVTGFSDIYLINNPDGYQTSLCSSDEVDCEEYTTDDGFSYFKNPGLRVCQYLKNADEPGWYRFGSSSSEPDCPVVQSPLGIIHPSDGFAGLCSADFSTCTEFIDPVSDIAKNLLFNSDLGQDVDKNYVPDGWNVGNSDAGANYLEQKLSLKRGTVYTFSFDNIINGTPPPINGSDLMIGVFDCPGLSSFDNSMVSSSQGICVNAVGEIINPGSASNFCANDGDCSDGIARNGSERCAKNNLIIPQSAYKGDWQNSNRSGLPEGRRFSGRFSTDESLLQNNDCKVAMIEVSENQGGIGRIKGQLIKELSVRETGVYYQLADSVNQQDCNGLVDPDSGCVLFNNRSQVNYKISESDNSYLKFDADMSGPDINSNIPVSSCSGGCDSNVILKVRPDRQCGQWLDCRTKIKSFDESGGQNDFCLELAACDSLDEKGNCNNFVFAQRQLVNSFTLPDNNPLYNLTAKVGDAKKLGNMSGYAKAGITLTDFTQNNSTISGYYPYNLMKQVGEVALVPNGSFEDWSGDGYPTGWEAADSNQSWDVTDFQVVSNISDTLAREGVAILGQGSLRINADKLVKSEFIDVNKNTDYVFSVNINTINLQPAAAQAVAEVYGFKPDFNPALESSESVLATVTVSARLGWQSKTIKFSTGGFSQIRIKLNNQNDSVTSTLEGGSYFDNVSLLPALKIADQYVSSLNNWQPAYVSRSCRVFPQSSALSCEYVDGEGIQQRGWSGYCLEADPVNPGICLQWWPIDLIRGDNFSQYSSFPEREPLYYCAKMATTPLSISAGTTGSQQPESDSTKGPWTSPNNEFWVFSGNRQLGQPNYIDIKVSTDAGGRYDFTGLRLSPDNNWEIGWVASGATTENKNYSDYATYPEYCIKDGEELDYSQPVGIKGVSVRCDDVRDLGSTSSTKLPDRLVEQNYNNQGLGPNGEILSAAQRAKLAVTDQAYCSQGYDFGLENGYKVIAYAKANFDTDGTFVNIEYGVCDTNKTVSSFDWEFRFSYAYCGELVQVVTPSGQNKAWLSRISAGSTYKVPGLNYNYTQGYQPFGSVVPPLPSENPAEWDSKDDAQDNADITSDDTFYLGNQPVFVEAPDTSFDWPYQARAGSPYSCNASGSAEDAGCYLPDRTKVTGNSVDAANRLKQLFAKSYNVWFWNGEGTIGGYAKVCQSDTPLAGRDCTIDADCYFSATACAGGSSCESGCLYDNYDDSDGSTNFDFVADGCANDCQREILTDTEQGACRSACLTNDVVSDPIKFCSSGSAANIKVTAGACKVESPRYQKIDRADSDTGLLEKYNSLFWDVPDTLCENNTRSGNSWCAVAPIITNISVNGHADDNASIFGSDTVILSFNPIVDSNQLPMAAYRVDWRDGLVTAVQGTPLRDKSNERDPYILSHSYDYYDILEKNPSVDDIYCNTGNETLPIELANLPRHSCAIKPKIQIIDNWGWCNGSINPVTRQKEISSEWGYRVNGDAIGNASCSTESKAWTAFPWYIIIAPLQ